MTAPEYQLVLQTLMEEQRHRFDRLENKLDKKVDVSTVEKLEKELDDLRIATLTSDSVDTMIAKAMQNANARGWTQKERLMAVLGFIFLTINFMLGLLALGPDLFGSQSSG
jgi:hypothetical protein